MEKMDKTDKRFYVPSDWLDGDTVTVTGAEYNHMINVMRLRVGDGVILCYGDGKDNHAEIAEVGKQSARVRVISTEDNLSEPSAEVTVFQALPKGDKLDLIVQKCSELGIRRIVPFVSKYTQMKSESVKSERLRRVAVESAKQCGLARVLEVSEPVKWKDIIPQLAGYDLIVHPYEAAVEPDMKSVLKAAGNGLKKVALIIGSEGGFDPQEAAALSGIGAKQVTLGRRILRTETAAIAVSAIVMYELGELSY